MLVCLSSLRKQETTIGRKWKIENEEAPIRPQAERAILRPEAFSRRIWLKVAIENSASSTGRRADCFVIPHCVRHSSQ
jgi:hypothetical protein